MPNNLLITGKPGSGKTTVLQRTISVLRDRGFRAGGIYCPEIRERGVRLGFKIIDIMTGQERILAHVGQREGPRVSKYRVNVSNVDELSESAIGRALREADFVAIDEIGPMELYSDGFRRAVDTALDSTKPLLSVVHKSTTSGLIGKIKSRKDVKVFEVTTETRNALSEQLANLLMEALKCEQLL